MTKELTVPFHEEGIRLIISDDGSEYVPLKPLCERFGMVWKAVHSRLQAQKERWGIHLMVGTSAGGMQEMTCIPRVRLGGWLYSINPNRVKPEARDCLIRYQQELDLVIDAYLTGSHTEEVATLRRHNAALKAMALASNPLLNRIRTLAEGGYRRATVKIMIGKSWDEAFNLFDAMHQSGLLLRNQWTEALDRSLEDASLMKQGDLLGGEA